MKRHARRDEAIYVPVINSRNISGLAGVPIERILELSTLDQLGIKPPRRLPMMLSFLDFRKIPLAGLWAETNFGTYGDSLSPGGINMWINRHAEKTTVTISFPDNEVARESVDRYVATLSEMFARVVHATADEPQVIASTENDNEAA